MTPWEGKGQCQKERVDGTGRGCRVEAVGSWGCRRRGRCPRTKIGESPVPGSPREEPPARTPPGPLGQQPAPLGRTSPARVCCCALQAPVVHQFNLGS